MRKTPVKKRVARWFGRRSTKKILLRCVQSVAAIVSLFAITWVLFHSPLLSVRSVQIHTSNDDVELEKDIYRYINSALEEFAYAHIPAKTIFLFMPARLEEEIIATQPRVRAIDIHWKFFNNWEIDLLPREPLGTHCVAEAQCVLVGTDGVVFAETIVPTGIRLEGDMSFSLGDKLFARNATYEHDAFSKVSASIDYLTAYELEVVGVSLRDEGRIARLLLSTGLEVILDANTSIYETTQALHVAFREIFPLAADREQLLYIDVTNPTTIIYARK